MEKSSLKKKQKGIPHHSFSIFFDVLEFGTFVERRYFFYFFLFCTVRKRYYYGMMFVKY